ncbi:hypothetical protein ACFPN2_28295 [Steroidobacter flavus]|uniref:Peptidase M48 domain-containing protein n=1 Tax=Steroidobacter flavus TaxID=1842136 RepID=A0ABV8T1A2_9GAMM
MAKQTRQSLADIARIVNETDYGDYLLSVLRPRLPAPIISLFDEDLLAVGGLHHPTPNAYVTPVEEGGFAIVLHTGMRDLLYRVTRLIATHTHSGSAKPARSVPDLRDTARRLAEVFWWLRETQPARVFGPEYPISTEQIKIAGLLTIESGLFLLAHEIGHVMFHGSDGELEAKLGTVRGSAREEEHAADVFALHLVLGMGASQPRMSVERRLFAYAGAELVLQIYRALEQFPGLLGASVHPPAAERLAHIRALMRGKCQTEEDWVALSSIARAFDALLTQMVAIIQDPGEHTQFFSREAERLATDFQTLLERCSFDGPDYATFYTEASRLFGQGYSHKFSEQIVEIVMAHAEALHIASEPLASHASNPLQLERTFRKLKLLYGFVSRLPEPARSLFGRAFSHLEHR